MTGLKSSGTFSVSSTTGAAASVTSIQPKKPVAPPPKFAKPEVKPPEAKVDVPVESPKVLTLDTTSAPKAHLSQPKLEEIVLPAAVTAAVQPVSATLQEATVATLTTNFTQTTTAPAPSQEAVTSPSHSNDAAQKPAGRTPSQELKLETKTVTLNRAGGQGYGFSIVGGGAMPITISKIQPGSVAAQSGDMFVGDQVGS